MLMRSLSQVDASKDYDGLALYSGGTDSTLAPLIARQSVGEQFLLVMIDIGENEAACQQAIERAERIGWDFLLVDMRENFADEILREAIRMRASYWGYPLGTPLGRAYQLTVAAEVVNLLNSHRRRLRYVIHGCTARQNTRYRIERFLMDLPYVQSLGPFIENVVTRDEKVTMLGKYGIQAALGDGVATDENIYCRAMEGDLLNSLDDPSKLPIYTTVPPVDQVQGETRMTLTFDAGIPVQLDGESMGLSTLVEECARRAANAGIGRICVFEDTIPELGYKERGVYEAPAAVVLAHAHRYLEGACLPKLHRSLFRDLRYRWAELVYRGDWHTQDRRALGAEGARLNASISGSVELVLRPGHVEIGHAKCDASLLLSEAASRGAY